MEREAFRQRMQQYKQARENNPQLKYWDWKKENDLGYQLYKNNLPSNLQVETDDYDLYGAYESNMQPELNEDGTYHLGSRDPYTGRILKSKQHPTYQKAIESEISAGYFPYEKNNITYTKTYSPVDISGYADGTDGVNDFITEQIKQKIQQAFDKSKTRTMPSVPLIGSTKNPQTPEQFDLERGKALQKYQKEIQSIESQGIYNFTTGQKDIPLHLQRQYEVAKKSYDTWNNMVYQPTVGGAIGPSCIYTATDNYGSQYLQPSNVAFMNQPASISGFTKINNSEVQPGDIVIRTDGSNNHAMIYAGRDNIGPIYNHSNGGHEATDYRKNAHYPAKDSQLSTYRFTGTHNDSIQWKKQYSGYAYGGEIDEIPPQNTSERPITNFDPKGDPYNPTYGYNPGAGYVSNLDPLGSLYVEGALLNPVFKLAGNAVSNVARGLTKYSSKYVPEVRRTVQDKINSLFRREAEDKARTYKLYDDAIESRNRIIEDLYSNPAYMERARQIQNTYGDDYAKVYEDIINQYNTNYWNLPNPVIKQLDAKAKMQAKDAAVNRYITRRQPAGYDDFEYQINRNLTEIDYPTTRHELGHYVDFNLAKSSNPDYSNSMFAELKRDLSKQKNPLFPDKTDYYSKGTEQKSYMNTLREYMLKTGMINNIGDKVTSRQIKKAIRSLPKDMRSIEAAYLQFATPGQYTKWFNKIPLLGTYPIVNKQFQNYEEDKDKAREQR